MSLDVTDSPGEGALRLKAAVRKARLSIEQSRESSYLSNFRESTRLLQKAVRLLSDQTSGPGISTAPRAVREELGNELELLCGELQRAERLHLQAGSLLAGWAQLFTAATSSEPACSYSAQGLPELVAGNAAGNLGSKVYWEA